MKKKKKDKKKTNKIINKQNIIYSLIVLIDILIIIYVARHNYINYVTIENKSFYLGNKRNLFLGRNYITLFTTVIVYLYFLLINKYYFHKRINIKYLILILLGLLLINCLIFYLFTIKVY